MAININGKDGVCLSDLGFPDEIIEIINRHGVDSTNFDEVAKLLTSLGLAQVVEDANQITLAFTFEDLEQNGSTLQADTEKFSEPSEPSANAETTTSKITAAFSLGLTSTFPQLKPENLDQDYEIPQATLSQDLRLSSPPRDSEKTFEESPKPPANADTATARTAQASGLGSTPSFTLLKLNTLDLPCSSSSSRKFSSKSSKIPPKQTSTKPVNLSTTVLKSIENTSGPADNISTQESNSSDQNNDGDTAYTTKELTPDILHNILKSSLTGKDILRLAEEGTLSDRRQLELAEFVAQWHMENRKKVFENDVKKYARAIVLLFQNEKEDSYFLPRGGDKKNPGGKIYNKINSLKAKIRKRKLDDERHTNKCNAKQRKKSYQCHDDATQDALKWLQDNDLPWTTVLDQWRASYPLRVGYLAKPKAEQELTKLNLWWLITSEFGYQLINIDYKLLYPGNNVVSTEWAHVLTVAGEYIKRRSIDEPSCQLLDVVSNVEISEDTRLCSLLLLLNCILHPQKVTRGYKPTVINGRDDTIIFAVSDADAKEKLAELYKRYEDLSIARSPKLVFFGKPTELGGVFRVYYHDVYYNLPSAMRAVDTYIKFTTVLGLKHSKISRLVWLFITRYVYKQKTAERYACIEKFKEFLEAAKNKENSK